MSKLLCNVLNISRGANAPNAPPGCTPGPRYALGCTVYSCCVVGLVVRLNLAFSRAAVLFVF